MRKGQRSELLEILIGYTGKDRFRLSPLRPPTRIA